MVKLDNIVKRYGEVCAADNVCISVADGESLVLAGESGSGKTTLAKMIVGMETPDSGEIHIDNVLMSKSLKKRSFEQCAMIQYIFQDPYSALEPNFTVRKTLTETERICKRNKREYIPMEEALAYVDKSIVPYLDRPVRELSGGQRQKVCIARALIPNPRLIIADESTSMLDKKSTIDIFDLINRIKDEKKISLLVILHDIDFSYDKWDRIAVMSQGKIVEDMPFSQFRHHAKHEYSKKLVAAYDYFNGEE